MDTRDNTLEAYLLIKLVLMSLMLTLGMPLWMRLTLPWVDLILLAAFLILLFLAVGVALLVMLVLAYVDERRFLRWYYEN